MVVVNGARAPAGWLENVELERLSDEAYYSRMRACSVRVRQWDDRYIGLLAGAVDRDLPRRRGFRDVYHMAAIQARMSRKKVREILRVSRALRGCPGLWRMFTRADVSWTRLRTIAPVAAARPDWDGDLCLRVESATRRELELWVRSLALRPASTGSRAWAATLGAVDAARQHTTAGASKEPGDGVGLAWSHAEGGVARRSGSSPRREDRPAANAENSRPSLAGGPAGPAAEGQPASATDPIPAGTARSAGSPDGLPPGDLATPILGAPDGTSDPVGEGRAARACDVAWTLAALGVDPLVIEELRRHQGALAAQGKEPSLVWVLEQAIRSYRPSGQVARVPYLDVMWRCPGCRRGSLASASGPLPVDEADAPGLRQSGATVDLERDVAACGLDEPASPEEAFLSDRCPPREDVCRPEAADLAGATDGTDVADTADAADTADTVQQSEAARAGNSAREDNAACAASAASAAGTVRGRRRRPRVPARIRRLVIALQRGGCAVRGCTRVPTELHHRDGYDPAVGHDPKMLHFICSEHHRLVHARWIENPLDPPWEWRLSRTPSPVPAVASRIGAHQHAYREHVHAPMRRDEELAATLAVEPDQDAPA